MTALEVRLLAGRLGAAAATERIKVVTTRAAAVASTLVVGTYDHMTKVSEIS
ncbi:MAG: hypothetical protein ACR2NT_16595 [Acidimicrobiia bacterium]